MKTAQLVIIAIIVIIIVIVVVVALVLYEQSVRKGEQIAANAAANKTKTSTAKPVVPNTGGGNNGSGGTNAGGVAGNVSWPMAGQPNNLDPYYQAQFAAVTFKPGKGFIMPFMNATISPNATNTWNPAHVSTFPNSGTLPYNSITFDQFMSQASTSTSLFGEAWDGEHTWINGYYSPFSNFGVSSGLDSSDNVFSPFFMISDIPQGANYLFTKDANQFNTTRVQTDSNNLTFAKTYIDIHSHASASTAEVSEILDSVTDTTASSKNYTVSITFTISIEIQPKEEKVFTHKFTKNYNTSTDLPIGIETPAMFLFNMFFNNNYSYLPSASTAASANPLFASLVMSQNSYITIDYERGYSDRIINTRTVKYPIGLNNAMCIDFVPQSSVNNPPALSRSNNHVICIGIPVPYFPKEHDLYLKNEIAANPLIVFDQNAP